MRNLKRVLSLALATVMMLGMMIITTSAAEVITKDFTDAGDIQYNEAVDVLVALEVLEGDDNGAFNPTQILTREQAAKIICYMLIGPENAEKLGAGSTVFTDVESDRWSAGYIAYCANLGIIAGNGDGTFDPEGQLIGVAFGKMLLVALGYDANIQGYVGSNWATSIATDMIDAGIDVKGVTLSAPLTREQAAQMAFQTLTADMVRYTSKGTEVTTPDGTKVVIGASDPVSYSSASFDEYNKVTGADRSAYLQFCEKYFTKLTKENGELDDFGRPASYAWKLDNNLVYNAAETPAVTFTAKTTDTNVAKALKGYTFNGTKLVDANTAIGGDISRIGALTFSAATDQIATVIKDLTATGKTVEFYADEDKAITEVVAITYTVETVNNITKASNGDVTYAFSVSGNRVDYADEDVTDQVVFNGTVAKGDVVTTALGAESLHVYPTTTVVGAQSSFNGNKGTIVVDGTTYTVATGVNKSGGSVSIGDFNNSKDAANYYLDQFGYAVKTDAISTVYTNYAQVQGVTAKLNTTVDGSTPVVEARFVLADGTVGTYSVKVTKDGSNYKIADTTIYSGTESEATVQANVSGLLATNTIFGYSLDENTITLQAVATAPAVDTVVKGAPAANIAKGATSANVLGTTTLLDSNTIYVLYNSQKKTATQYVGALPAGAALNAANTQVVALVDGNGTYASAKVVFGVTGDVSAADTSDYAYVKSTGYSTELTSSGSTRYVYEGVKADGSKITLYANNTTTVDPNKPGDLYTWNTESSITGAYTGSQVIAAATYNVVGDQIVNNATNAVYNIADASIVYIANNVTSIDGNTCVVVLDVVNGAPTNDAVAIFVIGAP